jgi:phage baseplate assembly protein W
MATLQDITSQDWSLSMNSPGGVVQDFADIQQCIYIILVTQKGTDPLRPDFGCGIHEYIDKPVSIAVPNMKREILAAIQKYEPRVKIISILQNVEEAHLTFTIEWEFANSTQTTTVSYGTA